VSYEDSKDRQGSRLGGSSEEFQVSVSGFGFHGSGFRRGSRAGLGSRVSASGFRVEDLSRASSAGRSQLIAARNSAVEGKNVRVSE
jgi:hypothetical protein